MDSADPRRIEVWVAMAEHFLDTETRHDIPLTALTCVRAGLSADEARDVWRHEVAPVVGFNAWDVAGEWAGWPRDWLVESIERQRTRLASRSRAGRWLRELVDLDVMRGVRVSVECCIDAMLAVPSDLDRERLFADLTVLARHYFDFGPTDFATLTNADRQRIRALYPEPFQRLLAPALVCGEAGPANRRVCAALQQI